MLGLLCLGILVGISFFIYQEKSTTKSEIIEESSLVKKKEKQQEIKEEIKEEYKVDIKGEVQFPGMYSLLKDSRVIDVIEKAGGLTENADISVINLSKKIQDEMVIIIYSREEVINFEKTKEVEKQVLSMCEQKDENSLFNNACINTSTQTSGKISLNTATVEELMTLNGVGESKAKDIINYRKKNGPFSSIEEIMNITGIGESLFAKIKEDITV